MSAQYIFDQVLVLFQKCADFGLWLFKEQKYTFLTHEITFTPIAVFGLTTFLVIFTLHVYHLINPGG